jgi:hypothetical protein
MSMKHGTYLGGIRTVDDLRQRCCIDEEAGCWLWGAGRSECEPCVRYVLDGNCMKTTGRRAALLLSGVKIPEGMRAIARVECRSGQCVNPKHCKVGTVRDIVRRLVHEGRFDTPGRRVRLARGNETRSKTTREQRLEVMLSDEPTASVAARLGISLGRVRQIRSAGAPAPFVNSVFNLGGMT